MDSFLPALAAILVLGPGAVVPGATLPPATSHESPAPVGAKDVDVDRMLERFERGYRGKDAEFALARLLDDVVRSTPSLCVPLLGAALESDAPGASVDLCHSFVTDAANRLLSRRAEKSTAKAPHTTSKKSPSPATPHRHPLPEQIEYRFGHRDLAALGKAPALLERKLQKGDGLELGDLSPTSRLHELLEGCLPCTEYALAGLMLELDVWHEGDDFALFLESWRNTGPDGDESFYEALDRTADTEEAVFFFDAMLASFVDRFAKAEGKRWSLEERHDRLHDAFLAFRQYRGFVEAVSYALVYPSSVAFPARLARYDSHPVRGVYNLRDDLDILVAANGGDPRPVFELCKDFLARHPFPTSPWEGYEVTSAFAAEFTAQIATITAAAGRGTDELLDEQRQRSAARAATLREATRSAFASIDT